MIVRIMGEGQWELSDADVAGLNDLDGALQTAVDSGDAAAFAQSLPALLARVRELGTPLPAEEIVPSELVLPSADSGLDEVRQLLGDEGLIPG